MPQPAQTLDANRRFPIALDTNSKWVIPCIGLSLETHLPSKPGMVFWECHRGQEAAVDPLALHAWSLDGELSCH